MVDGSQRLHGVTLVLIPLFLAFQATHFCDMEPMPSLEDLDNTMFGGTETKDRLPVIGR